MSSTLKELYARGGRIESSGWRVESVTAIDDDTARTIVLAGIRFPAEVVVQPGKDDIRRRASRGAISLYLTESPDGWITSRLDLEQ
jgi:hypothetical protein